MDMVQEIGHVLALSCSLSRLGVAETHNREMVQSYMTLPFLLSQESHHLTYVKSLTPA